MQSRGCHLSSPVLRIFALLVVASLAAAPAGAVKPKLSKYPLRIHVLAADETHRTPRAAPGVSLSCDGMDDMSSLSPDLGGGGSLSVDGVFGDPCSSHPALVLASQLSTRDEDPVFSGSGRADLVTPPRGTQGFSFNYDNCSRIRVRAGFQSLPARWKKPGKRLEVLIPSDAIPKNGRTLPPEKCSFTVTLHDYVYLLLRTGKVVEVSQDGYWQRPALRTFLAGYTPPIQDRTIEDRLKQYTVPAYPQR